MGDFAKVLYEKFFMRDFLGKLGPGAFIIVSVGYMLQGKDFNIISDIPSAILWVVGLPLAYLVGLGVQILGELIGIHSASPLPQYILFIPRWFAANIQFDTRLTKIGKATANQWTETNKEQKERFVVLKEASGNMGMAILISLILAWNGLGGIDINIFIKITGVVVVVLYLSHLIHARRQANYEKNVLCEVGLLTTDEANQMNTSKWLT